MPYLRAILTEPASSATDVLFASAVLPVPTYLNDAAIASEASRTLRLLVDRAGTDWSDFASYRFQREMNRSLVEGSLIQSDHKRHLSLALGVLRDPRAKQFELEHLRSYGWTDATIYWHLQRKLLEPAARDAAILPFLAEMANGALPLLSASLRDPRRTRLP